MTLNRTEFITWGLTVLNPQRVANGVGPLTAAQLGETWEIIVAFEASWADLHG